LDEYSAYNKGLTINTACLLYLPPDTTGHMQSFDMLIHGNSYGNLYALWKNGWLPVMYCEIWLPKVVLTILYSEVQKLHFNIMALTFIVWKQGSEICQYYRIGDQNSG
jgi:hypothetical protein